MAMTTLLSFSRERVILGMAERKKRVTLTNCGQNILLLIKDRNISASVHTTGAPLRALEGCLQARKPWSRRLISFWSAEVQNISFTLKTEKSSSLWKEENKAWNYSITSQSPTATKGWGGLELQQPEPILFTICCVHGLRSKLAALHVCAYVHVCSCTCVRACVWWVEKEASAL